MQHHLYIMYRWCFFILLDLISFINIDTGIGEYAKPLNTFINKVSKGIGIAWKPTQIRREAKAQAEASLIAANAQAEAIHIITVKNIELTDLQYRASQRLLTEETRRQENMETIADQALPLLQENCNPNAIEDDWIVNFFDKCRITSDEEMQVLWSMILAGEANAPGAFSKRTVNFLSGLDKDDALLFAKLCGFGWKIGDDFCPLIYDTNNELYKKKWYGF